MVARILSRCTTCEESEKTMRSEIEKKLQVRRILVLLSIVLVFLVVASILLFCVAYEIKKQREQGLMVFLDDIVCAANDNDCMENLCPVGMTWNPERSQCFETGEAKVEHHGLALDDLALCRCGYVWVDWRQRCMKQAGLHLCM